jgi:predicted nicotinamide N-methyase
MNESDFVLQSLKDNQQYDAHDLASQALGITSANWSLFGVLWPSSIILASTVAQLDLRGKTVLEIGCGIGLSSILLHSRGTDVTASDYHPQAREFLRINLLKNGLPPLPFEPGNWNVANPALGEFDLIIGSDVLYEPDQADKVSSFISQHSAARVQVIIVDPGRRNRSKFSRNMQSMGFSHHREGFSMMELDRNPVKGYILFYCRHP